MNDTPETDAAWKEGNAIREWACRKLERERDEANELLASEKITRNHIIQRGIEMQKERDEAKEALQILADYTKNEIKRLRMICQHAHDRLLRGAPDNDLLLILEKSWKEKTK